MSKRKTQSNSGTDPVTAIGAGINVPTTICHVVNAVLGNPPGPRVNITPLPEDKDIRYSMSCHLLTIAADHQEYISDSFDRGYDVELQKELTQARAAEDLAYALLSPAKSVSIDAEWSLWVADELRRLADDLKDDEDDEWANCETARALAETIMSCIETQGFSHFIVRN
jgi:hypothetical protein